MTVSCGRTGYVCQDRVKLDRAVMLRLWHAFQPQPTTTDQEGGKTFWRHEHPTLPFAMERFFEKENTGSWSTIGRFVGNGWEISFVHRKYRGKVQDVIDSTRRFRSGRRIVSIMIGHSPPSRHKCLDPMTNCAIPPRYQ